MCSMTFVMGATPPIGLKCGAFVAYDPLSGVLGCGSSSGVESEDVLKKQAVQNALDDCGSSQCKVYYGICLPVTARANLAWYVAASQSDPSVYAIVDASLRQPQHGRNEAMKKCSSLASDCKPVICKGDSRRTIQTSTPKNVCSAIAYDYDAGSIGICDQCNSTKDGAQTNAVGQCKHSVYGCSIKLSFCSKPGKMVGVLASNGPGEDSVYATSISTNVTEAILNAIARCNAKSELNDCDVETIVGDNQDRRRRQSADAPKCSAITYGTTTNYFGVCDKCASSEESASQASSKQCSSKGCGKGFDKISTLMTCNPTQYIGFASNGQGKGNLSKGSVAYGSTASEASTNALKSCNEAVYDEDGKLLINPGGCRVIKVVG